MLSENIEYKKQILNLNKKVCEIKKELKKTKEQLDEIKKYNEKLLKKRNNLCIVEDYKKQIESELQIVDNNNTQIEKLEILTKSSISSCLDQLMMDHINNGPKGYAKFALDFAFDNRIICTDLSKEMIKYKDENEILQTDEGGVKISKIFFKVVVPKSVELLMSEERKYQDEKLDEQQKQDIRVELWLFINYLRNIAKGDVEGEAYREEWSKHVAKGSVM